MYADDIVLLSPSAKGMQRPLDNAYTYGCEYDILFNSQKSQLMIFDTMILGCNIMLGEAPLTVTIFFINTWGILLQIIDLMKQTWKTRKGVFTGDIMLYYEHFIFAPMK